jgi:hypothetical protein
MTVFPIDDDRLVRRKFIGNRAWPCGITPAAAATPGLQACSYKALSQHI